MARLKEQCIWITGASSGIGRALALALCEEGNFVIVSGRNQQALNQLSMQAKGRIKPLVFDVTRDGQSLPEVQESLHAITDYLDGVICCAGICEYEDGLDFNPALYERVIDTNFLGVIRTFNAALPSLKQSQTSPFFAAVGSVSSIVGLPRAEAYGASKAALEYFIRSLQADSVNLPLRAHLIRPGFVKTSLTQHNDFPMPLIMSPDKAAQNIVQGIRSNKHIIDFPLRLSLGLKLTRLFYSLWLRVGAGRITRLKKADWKSP